MDYNQQQQFLRRYRTASLAVAALIIGLQLPAYLAGGFTPVQIAINSILTIALCYAIDYLPKYLQLTIETNKKFFWTIRIRWILSALWLVGGLFLVSGRLTPFLISVALLIGTNFFIRLLVKRQRDRAISGRLVGTIYALSDALALYLFFQAYAPNLIFQVLICSFAAHLAIQLNALLPMVIFIGSLNWLTSGPIWIYLSATVAAYLFTNAASNLQTGNQQETVNALVEFTGLEQREVSELLATSTGKLAANWHQQKPAGKAEVEKWYCENSRYYIYDLAQYHLGYKHIVFTLDVIGLARGRVLDYGAGIGDLSLALAARGHAVTYFDVPGQSREYAGWQAERANLKLKFASEDSQLQGEQFDTIIVLDVLEHLFEPEQTLEFLLSKLAPGGLMIVSAYFGATKSHPMHFDHSLNVAERLAAAGLSDAKGWQLRWFGSEGIRRRPMFVYRKRAGQLLPAMQTA